MCATRYVCVSCGFAVQSLNIRVIEFDSAFANYRISALGIREYVSETRKVSNISCVLGVFIDAIWKVIIHDSAGRSLP